MKFKILIASAAMVLLTVASAFATGYSYMPPGGSLPGVTAVSNTPAVHGSISSTAAVINVTGNKAEFSPYRDLTKGGGLFSNINLGYDSNNYWLQFNANDIGYKDQSYYLNGGMYDKYKFGAFYNQILHNITFGAISPEAGVGSMRLQSGTGTWSPATLPTNTSQWPSTFDYQTQRNQVGGSVSINLPHDLVADFSVMNEHKTGTYPMGGYWIEVPAPIDWVTQNYSASLRYQARPLFAQVGLQYSDFTDHDENIEFQVPHGSDLSDWLTMPSDNNFLKGYLQASLMLPYYSHFNVDVATSQYRSSADLLSVAAADIFQGSAAGPGHTITDESSPTFNGKRNVSNVYLTLASNPVPFLDGRLFYKYYNSTNNSQDVLVTAPGGSNVDAGFPTVAPLVFDYKTDTYGVNLGFALPASFHLDTEYELVHTERPNASFNLPNTNDNTYFAELRWDGLDWLTPRVSFRDFNRNSRGMGAPNLDKADLDYDTTTAYYQTLEWFNIAAQHTKDYKAEVDLTPIDALDVDLQYHYIDTSYPDTITGLLFTRTNEWDADVSYRIGDIATIRGYFDLDNIKNDTFFNSDNVDVAPADSTLDASNWNVDEYVKDDEYEWGLGGTVNVVPGKLRFNIRYDYMNSYGLNDLTILTNAALGSLATGGVTSGFPSSGANDSNIDMPYDTYKESSVSAKLVYNFTERLALTGGAEFDHFEYNDSAVNDYQYVYATNKFTNASPSLTPNAYFLGGAYSAPSYNANVEFVTLAYKF